MLDDTTGAYDKPLSIRRVLKANKIDMIFMDFMAWLPSACKELKRLATRVTKKKTKPAPVVPQATQAPQFVFDPMTRQPLPQFPLSIPPMYFSQPSQPQVQSQTQPGQAVPGSSVNVRSLGVGVDVYTRFLSTLVGVEKAFRIPYTIRMGDKDIILDMIHTQGGPRL